MEELRKNYNLVANNKGGYIVNDKVECFLDTKEEWKIERHEDYNLENINKYYNYLKQSDSEKDKLRIPLVEDYIKRNN